jgi:DNA recombination protein RmuC
MPLEFIPGVIAAAVFTFIVTFLVTRTLYRTKIQSIQQSQSAYELQKETLQEQISFLKYQENQLQEELLRQRSKSEESARLLMESSEEAMQFKLRNARLEQQLLQLNAIEDENDELQSQLDQAQEQLSIARQQLASAKQEVETEKTAREYEVNSAKEQLVLLQNAEQQLQKQFENLANQLFKNHAAEFEKSSQEKLNLLLQPLNQQLTGFRQQVQQQYTEEGKARASLKTEILNLQQLNKQITEEASALARALKGDNKKQGNWGEMVLQKILDDSGLRENHEYHTQVSQRNQEGKLYQPDVVVHLPQNKEVIIDSKVSLNAYEGFFNADSDVKKAIHIKNHIQSIKNHIKELGKKEYHELLGDRSLEYVLMFVPIEGAFMLAMENSPDLIKLAMDNNVLVVSPTNLMVALRTIHNIWQYEHQNQNAREIAKKAADLYDKFYGFVKDMEKLGEAINSVQKRYSEANNKLYEGRGNLVKKTEEFHQLGVTPSRQLETEVLSKAD